MPLVVIFGETSKQEVLGKNGTQILARDKRFIKGRYLDNGVTLGVKNLLGQVMPLVVIFGVTFKQKVLRKNGPQI